MENFKEDSFGRDKNGNRCGAEIAGFGIRDTRW